MKNLLKVLLVSIFVLLITGCGKTAQPKISNLSEKVNMSDFKVSKENIGHGIIKITVEQKLEYSQFESILKGSAYAIHSAFKEVMNATDKKYFMVLNKGISNLEGFPINNMNDFSNYMIRDWKNEDEAYGTPQEIYLKKGNTIRSKTYELFILPLDKKDEVFSVWSKAKLEQYYKNLNL